MPTQVSQPMRFSSRSACSGCSFSGPASVGLLFLDLLRALPEEEIGADGGAEDRDDQRQRLTRQFDLRHEGADRHRRPVDLHGEDHADIGQQRKGEPLQQPDIAMVGHEHDRQQGEDREGHRVQARVAAQHQLGGSPHGGEVGAEIDGVGDEQQQHQQRHDTARKDLHHVAGKTAAGDAADAGADRLHRHHQWPGQHHGPQQAETFAGARLGIGGDAAGIVVGRAGDDARPQPLEQSLEAPTRAGLGLGDRHYSVRNGSGPL